jgi:hypothetical protein
MAETCWLVLLSAAYPLWRAWNANRHTSLFQTIHWAIVAWIAWLWALTPNHSADAAIPSYVALSFSACANVAVLGAREPGVSAWNFVILGLLALLFVPVAEALFADRALSLGGVRTFFLGATLAVGLINYLPTRLAPAIVILFLGCVGEILMLARQEGLIETAFPFAQLSRPLLVASPWVAYLSLAWQPRARSQADALWLGFRDRFGLFWGQRLREQFNCSAANSGWPVHLRWQGLRVIQPEKQAPETQSAIVDVLRALLKRFVFEDVPAVRDSSESERADA